MRFCAAVLWSLVCARAQDGGPSPPGCVFGVPAGTSEETTAALRRVLAGALGGTPAADVRVCVLGPLGGGAPIDVQVLLLFDEWTLARLGAAGELATLPSGNHFELRFVDTCCAVAAAAAIPDAAHVLTWDELALRPGFHDRLGLVDPAVDGGPWLAAFAAAVQRSGSEDAGIALWTTLDARAGRLLNDPAELEQGMANGSFVAGLGRASQLAPWVEQSAGRLRLHCIGDRGVVRLGIAAPRGAASNGAAAVNRLLDPAALASVAGAARVAVAQGVDGVPIAGDHALRLWTRFQNEVRGRGRSAERIAEWLDVVFAVAFVVCAALLWRVLRTRPADG